jgi:hypothetical protein
MRNLLLVALALLVSGSVAMAQSKIDTKWHCPKATTEHKLDVGDAPDHIYWIGQGACEATASNGDLKEKSGNFTEFHDAWKASFNFHGYYNATMADGDKVNYTYEGSMSTDATKPAANKWKIVGGTGKHKGVKGSGTCAGKSNPDGSYDWECKGTYSMGMAKMDKMDKMSK